MKVAARIGIKVTDYYKMTMRELKVYIEAYKENNKIEQDNMITQSYLTAMWAAQWFSKKKPKPLSKILGMEQEKKKMTAEEMLEEVKKLNNSLGGTTY